MAEESGNKEIVETRVDEAKALEMAHAEKPYRDKVTRLKEEISDLEDKKGIGAFFKRWMRRNEIKKSTKIAEAVSHHAEDTIDFFREVKNSENAQKLFESAIDNSEIIGNPDLTKALHDLQEMSAEDLYQKQQDGSYYRDYPELARMVAEISFATVDKKSRKFALAPFGSPTDWNPLKDVAYGEDYARETGVMDDSMNRSIVTENAYTLLGLKQHTGDIPDMLKVSRYGGSFSDREYDLNDVGLKVKFQFTGPRTASSGEDVIQLPAKVDIKAAKSE